MNGSLTISVAISVIVLTVIAIYRQHRATKRPHAAQGSVPAVAGVPEHPPEIAFRLRDSEIMLAVVAELQRLYSGDMRSALEGWILRWPEFDWGVIPELIKNDSPNWFDWSDHWRMDAEALAHDDAHGFTNAFMELHAAYSMFAVIEQWEDRDAIIERYLCGEQMLMKALRTFRAYIPIFESAPTEHEAPDFHAAFARAGSPDEEAARERQAAAIRKLRGES